MLHSDFFCTKSMVKVQTSNLCLWTHIEWIITQKCSARFSLLTCILQGFHIVFPIAYQFFLTFNVFMTTFYVWADSGDKGE